MTVRQRSSWLHPAASALRGLPWMTGRRRDRGLIPNPADPEYWSIVVIDMAGSGRWDDRAQLRARAALDEMVRAAFRTADIAWHTLVVEYRGDGMIILVPATMSKVNIFDPVVPSLSAALREYNSMTAPRIRLRVAVHAGEVLRGRFGWVGTALNLACRLVDSQPLYRELTRCPHADMVLVVSDVIHQAVVRHGHRGVDPSGYTPVHVAVKEIEARAWVHTPGTMTTSRRRRRAQRFR